MYSVISGLGKNINGEALKIETAINKDIVLSAQGNEKLSELKRLAPGQVDEINQIIKSLAQGIEIIGFGGYKTNEVRREVIAGFESRI